MRRDARLYLDDILTSCQAIETYTQGLTFENFSQSSVTKEAVLWNLQIIGEAVKSIPPEVLGKAKGIPWSEIKGFRDVIVHGYFSVDEEILWDVVTTKIGPLKQAAQSLLDSLE